MFGLVSLPLEFSRRNGNYRFAQTEKRNLNRGLGKFAHTNINIAHWTLHTHARTQEHFTVVHNTGFFFFFTLLLTLRKSCHPSRENKRGLEPIQHLV